MTRPFNASAVALTDELRQAARTPRTGTAALRVIHQALDLTAAQAKALDARYSQRSPSELRAALRRCQTSASDPTAWEAVHREAWAHTYAAKLRHQARHHLDDAARFDALWKPVWDRLTFNVPAAAVALLCAEHINGQDLLRLSGPWIELFGHQPDSAGT